MMVREEVVDSQKIQTKADKVRSRMKQSADGEGSDADGNDGVNPVSQAWPEEHRNTI